MCKADGMGYLMRRNISFLVLFSLLMFLFVECLLLCIPGNVRMTSAAGLKKMPGILQVHEIFKMNCSKLLILLRDVNGCYLTE